jgi:hypothetical protein
MYSIIDKRSKRLESLAERNYMERVAKGEIEYQKAVMDNNNQGWKDELVLIIVVFANHNFSLEYI